MVLILVSILRCPSILMTGSIIIFLPYNKRLIEEFESDGWTFYTYFLMILFKAQLKFIKNGLQEKKHLKTILTF